MKARHASNGGPNITMRSGQVAPRFGSWTNVTRPAYCGWRTIRFLFVRYANGRNEMYDYARDPFELTDRHKARSLADVRRRLRQRTRHACVPPPPRYDWR